MEGLLCYSVQEVSLLNISYKEMAHVLRTGTSKNDVFYHVVTNCFRAASRINLFRNIVRVLTTEIYS